MKLINLIKKHSVFGFVFTISKAAVYFVPLLMADVLTKSDFGVLEYALAGLGIIINTLINLGVPGAYPFFILKEKKINLKPAFKLHAVILLIPFIINQILFFWFNLNASFYLAFNVSYIIANQVFYSSQLKSHEKSTFAVILDSGIYLILLVYFLAYKLNIIEASLKTISGFVLGYSFFYVVFGIYNFLKFKEDINFNKYKKILKFSIHLLLSTFLIFLITTSGRILVEYFFDFESVGVYAFYFRLAAIVVMIHQVINIAFFKKMYTLDATILDKYYHLFFGLIYILSMIIFFITPYIAGYFSNYFTETFTTYKALYFLLSSQMVVWIASALNSNIIDRENLTYKNNPKFLVLITLSALVFYLLKDLLNLPLLTFIHYTIIFSACLIQYFTLNKKNIYFKKSIITLTVTYIVTSCSYFILLN